MPGLQAGQHLIASVACGQSYMLTTSKSLILVIYPYYNGPEAAEALIFLLFPAFFHKAGFLYVIQQGEFGIEKAVLVHARPEALPG